MGVKAMWVSKSMLAAQKVQQDLYDALLFATPNIQHDPFVTYDEDGEPVYLKLTRTVRQDKDCFVFTLEISKAWFARKKDPGKSLLRWLEKAMAVDRKWRERTPGYEEIILGEPHKEEKHLVMCIVCHGRGHFALGTPCSSCHGSGRVPIVF